MADTYNNMAAAVHMAKSASPRHGMPSPFNFAAFAPSIFHHQNNVQQTPCPNNNKIKRTRQRVDAGEPRNTYNTSSSASSFLSIKNGDQSQKTSPSSAIFPVNDQNNRPIFYNHNPTTTTTTPPYQQFFVELMKKQQQQSMILEESKLDNQNDDQDQDQNHDHEEEQKLEKSPKVENDQEKKDTTPKSKRKQYQPQQQVAVEDRDQNLDELEDQHLTPSPKSDDVDETPNKKFKSFSVQQMINQPANHYHANNRNFVNDLAQNLKVDLINSINQTIDKVINQYLTKHPPLTPTILQENLMRRPPAFFPPAFFLPPPPTTSHPFMSNENRLPPFWAHPNHRSIFPMSIPQQAAAPLDLQETNAARRFYDDPPSQRNRKRHNKVTDGGRSSTATGVDDGRKSPAAAAAALPSTAPPIFNAAAAALPTMVAPPPNMAALNLFQRMAAAAVAAAASPWNVGAAATMQRPSTPGGLGTATSSLPDESDEMIEADELAANRNGGLFDPDKFSDGMGSELAPYDPNGPHSETLTPMHLRKAKLMFFYTRYPNSQLLKAYFPDISFQKNNTAQLVKWFSNFREFYYIQIEKFARQALAEGIHTEEELRVNYESELYRNLNLHYNRNNHIQVPPKFRFVVEETLKQFFGAIQEGRDVEPSWKKTIYKIIARHDELIPEYFKSPNFLEQLE